MPYNSDNRSFSNNITLNNNFPQQSFAEGLLFWFCRVNSKLLLLFDWLDHYLLLPLPLLEVKVNVAVVVVFLTSHANINN